MSAACPEALSQGETTLSHQRKRSRKKNGVQKTKEWCVPPARRQGEEKIASTIRSKSTTSGREMGNPRKNSRGEERWRPLLVNEKSHSRHGNSKKLDRSKTSRMEASETNKELKQSNGKDQANAAKKEETLGKEKPLAILMVQPWQRVAKQRITQTFSSELVIYFPPLKDEDGTEGPMIIKAEIRGHFVHCMYVDGGSSSEIMYEHCFNRFRPEVKSQMVPATTPLVGFSEEIIWPLGQISLLVKIGDEEHSTFAWMNFMILLYRGEYSQWVERFMNYLEEQTDGEAIINSIKNDDQPLPRVTQVSIAGTTSTEQPPMKDKSMWSDQ
nr:reverse transcriptase domain-containing protein [Tanacetum cinerariifolium]